MDKQSSGGQTLKFGSSLKGLSSTQRLANREASSFSGIKAILQGQHDFSPIPIQRAQAPRLGILQGQNQLKHGICAHQIPG